jgi:hypothetical protein
LIAFVTLPLIVPKLRTPLTSPPEMPLDIANVTTCIDID